MSADASEDDALMVAWASGDGTAFERLFARHRAPVFTYLLHQTGDRARAEDLFQEVFLRLVRTAGRYEPRGRFRAWLLTIAHHALTDARRRMALRDEGSEIMTESRSTDENANAPSALDPVTGAQAGDLREHLEAALARLPDAQREVFLLRERGGLELRHIAEVTGANLATVKSRLRYALAGLRRLLEDRLTSLPELFHE